MTRDHLLFSTTRHYNCYAEVVHKINQYLCSKTMILPALDWTCCSRAVMAKKCTQKRDVPEKFMVS